MPTNSSEAYSGQKVKGCNDQGCLYIEQTVAHAVTDDSLAFVPSSLNITIEELLAMIENRVLVLRARFFHKNNQAYLLTHKKQLDHTKLCI